MAASLLEPDPQDMDVCDAIAGKIHHHYDPARHPGEQILVSPVITSPDSASQGKQAGLRSMRSIAINVRVTSRIRVLAESTGSHEDFARCVAHEANEWVHRVASQSPKIMASGHVDRWTEWH
jgi:hypothetical protein